MIPLVLISESGYNVPPNHDSPYLLAIAVIAAVGISVLIDRQSRKKHRSRPDEDEPADNEPAETTDTDEANNE